MLSVGDKFPDPRLKPLIPNPETANRTWSQAHGGVPINHMLVIRAQLAQSRPDVVREVYRVFREAKEASFAESGIEYLRTYAKLIGDLRRNISAEIRHSEASRTRIHRQEVVGAGVGKPLLCEAMDLNVPAVHVEIELCMQGAGRRT